MEPTKHPNLAAGIGAVILVLFVLCLMPVSCGHDSPLGIVDPGVEAGIVQETLPFVVDPLTEIQGEDIAQK